MIRKKFARVFVAVASIFFLTMFFPMPSLANVDLSNIKKESVLPDSFAYPLKRLLEKTRLLLSFSQPAKLRYNLNLLEKRASELKALVESDTKSVVETSSQRFAYQAGIVAKFTNNPDDLKVYIPLLEKLRDNFPANGTYWLSIQQDIDAINILTRDL